MVALANERLKGRALVIRGDVSETSDVIVSSLVIHYLTNLAKTFVEWVRILRPGEQSRARR